MQDDLVKNMDTLATGATLTTQTNKILPQPAPTPAIPARTGTGQPKLA